MTNTAYQVYPIGHVQVAGGMFSIVIDPDYRSGLKKLDEFSHVIVYWWANQVDNVNDRATRTEKLYYADNIEAGIFACRTPRRPNPIAMSVCQILNVNLDTGVITVPYIDADPNTPVIDLKPYIGMSDRVRTLQSASWFQGWPEWIPETEDDMPDWVMQKLMLTPEE